ncbi:MAG TPA: hypothetical protein ENI80_07935 [Acidiferrobacteraceae bacterium]|nr:hypothetical protein [Acidiferrobacteraceae bacterium]
MAVRIKSKWHHTKRKGNLRGGRKKTLEDRANVLAHNIWKIAFASYKHLEEEKFKFDTGPQITLALTEIVAFLIQVADRTVFGQINEEDRKTMVEVLGKQLAATIDDNLTELLGAGDYRKSFIDTLNQRFQSYAQCAYGDEGPEYSFLRLFGDSLAQAMAAANNKWVVEYVMEIEAPLALKLLYKTVAEVLGVKAPQLS